ncbi:phosphate ABC transporter substrate-binding protein [Aneurinibacillus terranovensis]|uniref:phosphate ABC transporter substrate-binding protein n=1 Tax=Aneurinibacillus terranovensis TaxID=278991 RepID=UPI000414DB83|nr:phosphate ABC transporter substrate-binding protein [Aneurinibacillus terranovensis]
MNLFKKVSTIIMASALLMSSALGIAQPSTADAAVTGKVTIAGSSALLPLSRQAINEFKRTNPGVVITASASSSISGPQSVLSGAATIGACDWNATKAVPGFKAFPGLVAHKVSVTPFATIVNKSVNVDNLTTSQLQGIFSGKITNWKQVGGQNAPIVVINRAFGSGTRVNYQIKALKGATMKGAPQYKEVKSSGDMKTAVSTTPNAIGYIDLVYVTGDLKAVKYNGVAPTTQNVINGKYPVWEYGYYLTKGQPTGATKAFIDYVTSSKFQQGSLRAMKFIPVTSVH